jgi:hypothetical protein
MEKSIDKETLQDLRDAIHREVAGGFTPEDEIVTNAVEFMADEYEPDDLEPHALEIARELLAAHKREQESWPDVTDCDRLDSALAALEATGIVCRQDFTCCGTCGAAEIGDEMEEAAEDGKAIRGYVFYHMQDTEHAVDGYGLYLSYGSVEDDEASAVGIGRELVAALRQQGLEADWNGSLSRRIGVSLDWKRRR